MTSPILSLFAASQTVFDRLPADIRLRLALALVGFLVLVAGWVLLVRMGSAMVRRQVVKPLPPVRNPSDAWAGKPLFSTRAERDDEDSSTD